MTKPANRREILKGALGAGVLGAGALKSASEAQAQFGWMKPQPQTPQGPRRLPFPEDSSAIVHYPSNCERCGACVETCRDIQKIFTPGQPLQCIHCGQCTANCWYNGVTERFQLQEVYNQISKKGSKKFVALVAPAVRATLGEMFKMPAGTNVEGQTVAALRKLGFDRVLDVTFGADLTVMEEAAEFEARLANKSSKFPMFTSCCPAWIQFVEHFYPRMKPQISTCKSPIMMQSAVVKSYYAQREGWDPKDVVVVALTPCTAKKYEKTLGNSLDFALTTRELGWWIAELRIPFSKLAPEKFDSLMSRGSGAGVLFGNTGGVTEAVLRTLYFQHTGKKPPKDWLTLSPIRGLDGIRKAEVEIDGKTFRIALANGIGTAREMIQLLETVKFDFVEVMACRGGCIGGGGTPKTEIPVTDELRIKRMTALFNGDKSSEIRLSCQNPDIIEIYDKFLKKTGNPLLHTEKHDA